MSPYLRLLLLRWLRRPAGQGALLAALVGPAALALTALMMQPTGEQGRLGYLALCAAWVTAVAAVSSASVVVTTAHEEGLANRLTLLRLAGVHGATAAGAVLGLAGLLGVAQATLGTLAVALPGLRIGLAPAGWFPLAAAAAAAAAAAGALALVSRSLLPQALALAVVNAAALLLAAAMARAAWSAGQGSLAGVVSVGGGCLLVVAGVIGLVSAWPRLGEARAS